MKMCFLTESKRFLHRVKTHVGPHALSNVCRDPKRTEYDKATECTNIFPFLFLFSV